MQMATKVAAQVAAQVMTRTAREAAPSAAHVETETPGVLFIAPRAGARAGALLALLCVLGVSASCGRPDTLKPSLVDGHKRLGDQVVPTAYLLDLRVDPRTDSFSGTVKISVKLSASTDELRLHAQDMTLSGVTFSHGSARIKGAARIGSNGGVALKFHEALPAGEGVVRIDFKAPLRRQPEGLYRVKERGRWYAFTQFEPMEARRAFPCFDEPRFKTPYTVTLTAPKGMIAASNAPAREYEEGAQQTSWRFKPTRALPTYLVAFAVGDFDVVEAPAGASHVPLRILAPKGKGALAKHALAKTPAILKALEGYFGMPYPYQKLDLVAVPEFSAGAMENVGLVTFREQLLLYDGKRATPSTIRRSLVVIAHELAHMWFGNLVTPLWWDELWLNEAFATWMADRATQEVAPELNLDERRASATAWVMSSDTKAQTRAIRTPIRTGGDVYNAFDGITYQKGAAVLGMIEAWIGRDAFRGALRALMKQYAHGSMTTKRLVKALEASSGKPVGEVLGTFIDQPGVPTLHVQKTCKDGQTTLTLRQERYLPAGAKAKKEGRWLIPMCARYGLPSAKGATVARHCALIKEESATITLPGKGCAAWVHPNDGEVGYYHWSLPAKDMQALASLPDVKLSPRERVAWLGHMRALVLSGDLPAEVYDDAALRHLRADTYVLASRAVGVITGLRDTALRVKMEPAYRAALQKHLRPEFERLGLEPRDGESLRDRQLRRRLISALGHGGADPYIIASAQSVAALYLKDHRSVPTARAGWAVPIATRYGGAEIWDALRAKLRTVSHPGHRRVILRALVSVDDPTRVQRALALALHEDVRANEVGRIIWPLYDRPEKRAATWTWLTGKYDAIVKKIGVKSAGSLPWYGAWACTPEERATVSAFFTPRVKKGSAAERNMALMLEGVDQCIAQRKLVDPARHARLKAQVVKEAP